MTKVVHAHIPSDLTSSEPVPVVEARELHHGDYTDNATLSQSLKDVMRGGRNWSYLSPMEKESLELIAVKIGRILSGDHRHVDHWVDIGGYADLAARGCRGRR